MKGDSVMSVVIAVVQQKGGAGKTPTAVHLSYALSYSGKNTLLIDLDAQATASLHLLGPMYKEAQPTIYNALVTLKAIPPTPIKDHLYLLSAHDELEKAEIELPRPGSFYQVQLAKLLKQYQQYDYVVIDTPGSRVSIFAALALTAATMVIVPCKTEIAQAMATGDTMNLIEDVRGGLNPHLLIWGILPTQYESKILHHQEVLELLQEMKDPQGNLYPIYAEPSRKTTRYNDATSMKVDARQLEPSLGKYWDQVAVSVIESVQGARTGR
jgi:chromosome partitioning protein